MEQVEDEPPTHGEEFQLVVPEGARGQLLVEHLTRRVFELAHLEKLRRTLTHQPTFHDVLQVKTEDVPPGDDVHVGFAQVPLKPFEQRLLGVKALHFLPLGLLVTEAHLLVGFVAAELAQGEGDLKAAVIGDVGVRELPSGAVALDVHGRDDEWGDVIPQDGRERGPVVAEQVDVHVCQVGAHALATGVQPPGGLNPRAMHHAEDGVEVGLVRAKLGVPPGQLDPVLEGVGEVPPLGQVGAVQSHEWELLIVLKSPDVLRLL